LTKYFADNNIFIHNRFLAAKCVIRMIRGQYVR
jgi:hypothetical protein